MLFEPHSEKQSGAIFSDKRLTVLLTGIQFGKTSAGSWWLYRKTQEFKAKNNNFLVVAPTYKILEQSTLPSLLPILDGLGHLDRKNDCFRLYDGGTIYFRTNTHPDSIVGLTNVRAIWGDEAGKFTLYFWENIQGRSSFKKCPVFLTTSPYALNWLYKDVFRPYRRGQKDDTLIIQARSNENPYFPAEEFESKKRSMDPRRFNAMYGGDFERMEGLVYNCWDDELNRCRPFLLPSGTRYFAGVDWGFTDPFVIKVRAITPAGEHYGISEFYKTGVSVNEMIDIAKMTKQTHGIERFFCDPSRPDFIEMFNSNGLPAEGADNSIQLGIDLHYELIKSRKYKEFTGACPHSDDEREMYHYPEPKDLKPDQDAKDVKPVSQYDHTCDVDRYLTIMTYKKHMVKAPDHNTDDDWKSKEQQHQRVERLKRGINRDQTEDVM